MVLVLLTPAVADLWNIRRGNITLFRELALGPAIKLARELARDEHLRSGRDTCVEMSSGGGPIRLALHARSPAGAAGTSGDSVAA